MSSILRQLLKEFWMPLLVAMGWSTYNAISLPQENGSLTSLINIAAPTFFFVSWLTAQYFRVKKQESVSTSLGSIEGRIEAILNKIEKQTADLAYIANGTIVQTFDECIDLLRESNEDLADKTRLLKLGEELPPTLFRLYKQNPFYDSRKNVGVLISYMGHVISIGYEAGLEARFTRGAHYIEELAGHIRAFSRRLDQTEIQWRTDRSRDLIQEIAERIDRFRDEQLRYSRYHMDGYKGGQRLNEVLITHTLQLRKISEEQSANPGKES